VSQLTANIHFAGVRLANGLRTHYAEGGDPAAHPLLLLHGLSDSWYSYSRVLSDLAARYHVFALDQRGHGDTDKPATGYAAAELAADALAFLDAMELPRAAVVGHSMGSEVAIELALAAPERLSALVLVGANTSWNAPELREFQQLVNGLADPVSAAFVREFQAGTAYAPLPEAFLDSVVEESMRLPAHVWRGALAGQIEADYAARLGAIRTPALVLGGEEDPYCPAANQSDLAARLGNAKLRLYPRVAHCPHWERPDEFVRDLTWFLDRVGWDASELQV
jgi:non-heme chloroperoxidase